MAGVPHDVSFHQFCLDNAHTFWRISVYGQPVALSNVSLRIFRKIINMVKSCHDNNMSSGNLLDNIRVINNEDVLLAVGPIPIPLGLDDRQVTIYSDLLAVWDLVVDAVTTTGVNILDLPAAVVCLHDMYTWMYTNNWFNDLRRIEFYIFNSPLFLDSTGKFLLFRKVLNMAEHDEVLFLGNVDLQGIGNWLPYVHNNLLTTVRDHRRGVNLGVYGTPEGSIRFFRNALAHVNQGSFHFMSDASVMTVLEDELPWVMPRLFNALVGGMDENPACIQMCGETLDTFLRAEITVFA